ncbi:hypothetical protein GUJ93_ZPchr0009g631 [Zizania palustris]|uniref:Uncharacterized protein n=1 Tax=Zizania palustris TaxID=103762 RepID=A0A8J5VIT7_ZIZPA|nr:hypothetical protein GUJ93_ZPchr0009g631 [Zizania palustris]
MASSQRSRSRSSAAVPVIAFDDEPGLLVRPREEDQEAAAAATEEELRRGPWTVDEDHILISYIAGHGEGRWNSLARAAGLKRTGKSCRLRWLNYLRPDVKRGNFTADEQLLILDLHSRWGNRWSKIAQHLPGRTDNEIKNYWRTRVQKHAKQLNCDASSARFKDAMRYLCGMPRLGGGAAGAAAAGVHQQQAYAAAAAGGAHRGGLPAMSSSTNNTPSSSESFATSELSYDGGLYHASVVHENEMAANNGGTTNYRCWMLQQGENQAGLCCNSGTKQVQHHHHDEQHDGQFQDPADLVGWVQGFSDGLSDSLWSLEDIWKMQ